MEWQPGETAPKDGRQFIAYIEDRKEIDFAFYAEIPSERFVEIGDGNYRKEKYDAGHYVVGRGFSTRAGTPLYWMPLPQPPEPRP